MRCARCVHGSRSYPPPRAWGSFRGEFASLFVSSGAQWVLEEPGTLTICMDWCVSLPQSLLLPGKEEKRRIPSVTGDEGQPAYRLLECLVTYQREQSSSCLTNFEASKKKCRFALSYERGRQGRKETNSPFDGCQKAKKKMVSR